jgi:hypothetical protein
LPVQNQQAGRVDLAARHWNRCNQVPGTVERLANDFDGIGMAHGWIDAAHSASFEAGNDTD